jgi:type I restriction enzyme S subunit
MKFLFDNFDILAQAPGGIKKLREMILQLAVQGKLVPQNPKDEPASILLEKIKKEKELLLKEGKIKKQKPLEPIKENQIPYKLSDSWEWCRLNKIVKLLGDGLHGTPNYDSTGEYFFINGNNLIDGKIIIKSNTKTVSHSEYTKYKKDLNTNTVLVSINGTIGNVAFYNSEHVMLGKSACYFNLFNKINKYYAKIVIKSSYFIKYVLSKATGSTIKNVSLRTMRELPFPLPPLSEQKRIVAKVDSLMALCDDLEKQQQEKTEKKLKFNKASLHELHSSTTKQTFNKNWNHITKNFDLLYNTQENVDDLKQTILQLAVQGKLVPQNPNDEPASILLEKIKKEKERLLKEGKIKKQKPLEPIKESEIPFALPEGWLWVRLGTILYITSGKNLTSKQMQAGEIPVYGGNGVTGYHNTFNIGKKTLVIGRVGFYCGSIHITPEKAWVTDNAFRTVFPEQNINIDFLSILLRTFDLKLNENATAQPVISGKKIYPILLSLPPFTEQKRIVVKVDSLMALCDQLSQMIVDKEKHNENLLNSVVSQI